MSPEVNLRSIWGHGSVTAEPNRISMSLESAEPEASSGPISAPDAAEHTGERRCSQWPYGTGPTWPPCWGQRSRQPAGTPERGPCRTHLCRPSKNKTGDIPFKWLIVTVNHSSQHHLRVQCSIQYHYISVQCPIQYHYISVSEFSVKSISTKHKRCICTVSTTKRKDATVLLTHY